jgi:hypothetical protein
MDVVFLPTFFFNPSSAFVAVGSPSKGHPRHSGKESKSPSISFSVQYKGDRKRRENPADGHRQRERGGEMRRVQSGPKEKKKKELALIQQQCAQDIESIHPSIRGSDV